MKKRALAWVMTFAMMLSLLPAVGLSALAAPGDVVKYIDADGTEKSRSLDDCTVVTSSTTSWSDGVWYVVNSTDGVTITGRITVSGAVHLILVDGASLTASAGINVSTGNSLTIYGQEEGTGKLTATGGTNCAGIGGNDGQACGDVTINGGDVTAVGTKKGAGIGGGRNGAGGKVVVNGGSVTAKSSTESGDNGAGIGMGHNGGDSGSFCVSSSSLTVKAGKTADSTTLIENKPVGTNLQPKLVDDKGKALKFVTVEAHIHSWTYEVSEDGKTIKATCDCGDTQTLSILPPDPAVYDGTEKPASLSVEKFAGKTVSADNIVYYEKGEQMGGKPINVGTYVAKFTFEGKTISVEYNITPVQLTLGDGATTAEDKTYDGDTEAVVNVDNTKVSGLIAGHDDVTVAATGDFDNQNVGNGKPVTVTYKLEGTDAKNYAAPNGGTVQASITAVKLTVVGTTVSNKDYDGTTNATVNCGTVSGIVGEDDVEVVASGTFPSADADEYGVEVTYTLVGNDKDNYDAPESDTCEATISKIDQTINLPAAQTKTTDSITLSAQTGFGDTWYRLGAEGEWQTSRVFTGLNADTTYNFYAKYEGDKNHNEAISTAAQIKTDEETPHQHDWTFSLATTTTENDTIKGECKGGPPSCPEGTLNEMTLVKPTMTYYGEEGTSEEATITGGISGVETPDIYYEGIEGTDLDPTTDAPTDAGNYKASITVGEDDNQKTAYVEYTIAKRSITLTSEDLSKTYDGTTLEGGGTITAGDKGYVTGEELDYEFTGSQFKAGSSDNTFTWDSSATANTDNYDITPSYGKLTVAQRSGDDCTITVTSSDQERPYDGTDVIDDDYTATVTKGSLGTGDEIVVELSNSEEDAGTYEIGTTCTIMHTETEEDVTDSYGSVIVQKGTLTITKCDITLTSGSDTRMYNGTPLTNVTVDQTGTFADGEGFSTDPTATGSQTVFGNCTNTIEYTLKDNTNPNNYNITKTEGTLTVTKRTGPGYLVTVTPQAQNTTYNGEKGGSGFKTNDTNPTIGGSDGALVSGDAVTATVSTERINAGSGDISVDSYKIMNDDLDVTECYGNVTTVTGTVTIGAKSLTLSPSASQATTVYDKLYDGNDVATVYVNPDKVSGIVSGDTVGVSATGQFADKNADENIDVDVTYYLTGKDAGNYSAPQGTTLKATINKRSVTMTSASDTKVYDNYPLTNKNVTVTGNGFISGEGATYNVTGSQTEVGSSPNYFTYALNAETSDGNYTINMIYGTLTVTKKQSNDRDGNPPYRVTIADSAKDQLSTEKVYYNKGKEVTVTANSAVETVTVKTELTGVPVAVVEVNATTYTFTMPACDVIVSTGTKQVVTVPNNDENTGLPFVDVHTNDWFYDGVYYCYTNGIMTGVSDFEFGPYLNTTRAMMATILWRMAGSPIVTEPYTFQDVPEGKWYTEAIRWASSVKVVLGFSDTEFRPEQLVTREQLAAMIYRYEQTLGNGFQGAWAFNLPQYDASSVGGWAYESMCWCVMKGIINGDDKNNLNPQKFATRAEVATIFMNLDKMHKAEK